MTPRRRALLTVLAALLVACGIGGGFMLRAIHRARYNRAPAFILTLPPLQAADPAIDSIDVAAPVVTIWSDVKNAPDLAGNIDIAADTVRSVGKALQRGVSDDLKGVEIVRFEFRAEATNRFDRDVMAKLMTLDMPLADLKAANVRAMNGGQLLGLAYKAVLGAPGAYDALDAWCKEPAKANPAFCAKARGK